MATSWWMNNIEIGTSNAVLKDICTLYVLTKLRGTEDAVIRLCKKLSKVDLCSFFEVPEELIGAPIMSKKYLKENPYFVISNL